MANRLTHVTIDGLNMLKMHADGETDFQTILKNAIAEAGAHKRQKDWAKKAGVSQGTINHFAHDPDVGMTLYNAENLLRAAGLRLTIEVDT